MKTILLIPEFSATGGTRTYFKYLLEFYDSLGFEVVLAINKQQVDKEVRKLIEEHSIKYFFIPKRIRGYRNLFTRSSIRILWDFFVLLYAKSRYDFDYIVCSIGTAGDMLGAFFFNKKVIYILHTYPTARLPQFIQEMLKMRFGNDRKIINVSQFTNKQVCRLWLGEEENEYVKCIYSFSSNEKLRCLNEKKEREFVTVLTLGHVRDYKNPQLWIEVAQAINEIILDKKIKFIWAGSGELLEEYKNISSQFGDSIQFIGHKNDVTELYKLADIYFQPSKIENLSISILDAMNYGIPCIVSEVGGNPELVTDGENGFVIDICDKQMVIEKVLFLINNEEKRQTMGKASKERYERYFTKDIWNEEMKKLYQ